jgi:hypothetical protein
MMSSPYLPLQDIVDVVVTVSPQLPATPTFNQGLIVGNSGVIPTSGNNSRIRKYSTLAGMLSDGFTTSSPEYIAASLYFSQNPAPQYLWVGAQNPSGLNTVVPHSGNTGSSYKVGDVITVVQSGGSLGTLSVATIGGGGSVTGLTLLTAGQGYSVATGLTTTGGSGTGLEVDISSVGEPALLAVIACRAAQSAWWGFYVTDAVDADHLALALWAQSAVPAAYYFYNTADANVLNNVANNIAAVMQADSYSYTLGVYSTTQSGVYPNNTYFSAAVMGYAMGANSGLAASYFTLAFKNLAGVAPEPLTQSQVTTLLGLNINLYLNYGNAFTFLQPGTSPSGIRYYQTLGRATLAANIQFNVMDVLVSLGAVPQTDPGETQLIQAVNQAAALSASIGYIAPGTWEGITILNLSEGDALPTGYFAQAPPYATQSQAARAAFQAMPIYLAIIEAGAVESIVIGVAIQAA